MGVEIRIYPGDKYRELYPDFPEIVDAQPIPQDRMREIKKKIENFNVITIPDDIFPELLSRGKTRVGTGNHYIGNTGDLFIFESDGLTLSVSPHFYIDRKFLIINIFDNSNITLVIPVTFASKVSLDSTLLSIYSLTDIANDILDIARNSEFSRIFPTAGIRRFEFVSKADFNQIYIEERFITVSNVVLSLRFPGLPYYDSNIVDKYITDVLIKSGFNMGISLGFFFNSIKTQGAFKGDDVLIEFVNGKVILTISHDNDYFSEEIDVDCRDEHGMHTCPGNTFEELARRIGEIIVENDL